MKIIDVINTLRQQIADLCIEFEDEHGVVVVGTIERDEVTIWVEPKDEDDTDEEEEL